MPNTPDRFFGAYLFDLDGTLYLGDEVLPGALELLAQLREGGVSVRFVSNNPTKGPEDYLRKLTSLGFEAYLDEIASTAVVSARWIARTMPGARVFPIGEGPLLRALVDAGVEVSEDPAEIDVVLASYDRGFDYGKLQVAFDALWQHGRAVLIGTNPDRYCPFPGGRGEPDCAAIVAAIEACSGVKCELFIGKPNPLMLEEALVGVDVGLVDTIMVGDRLATDIAMGRSAGMATALVLTGDSTAGDVEELAPEDQPTFVLDGVGDLIPAV